MTVAEPDLVPIEARWKVWTDHEAHKHHYRGSRSAVWFWAASGPRGHMSGAETIPSLAVDRAQAAAWMLGSSAEREHAERKEAKS